MTEIDPIPERMKEIRLRMGLSQRQLAEMMRVGKNSISAYETGKVHPTSIVLRRFLLVTEESPYYLFDLPYPESTKLNRAREDIAKAYSQCRASMDAMRESAKSLNDAIEEMKI